MRVRRCVGYLPWKSSDLRTTHKPVVSTHTEYRLRQSTRTQDKRIPVSHASHSAPQSQRNCTRRLLRVKKKHGLVCGRGWYSDWLRDRQPRCRNSSPGRDNILFLVPSRPYLGPTQPHIKMGTRSSLLRDKATSAEDKM
jgi:hypothetical protein